MIYLPLIAISFLIKKTYLVFFPSLFRPVKLSDYFPSNIDSGNFKGLYFIYFPFLFMKSSLVSSIQHQNHLIELIFSRRVLKQ